MSWSTWERLVQKKKKCLFFVLPTVNAYQYLTSLKVCDWSGHIYGASGSPRSFTKKDGYVTLLHCPWRSAWYQICDIRVAHACGFRVWRKLGIYAWNSSKSILNPWSTVDHANTADQKNPSPSPSRSSGSLVKLRAIPIRSTFQDQDLPGQTVYCIPDRTVGHTDHIPTSRSMHFGTDSPYRYLWPTVDHAQIR